MLSSIDFDTQYEVVRNKANGNCLFDSISYLMNGLYDGVQLSQEDIRLQVYEFYKDFDRDIKYQDDLRNTIPNEINFFSEECIMKRPVRQSDGLFHLNGKTFKELYGSRQQVWNGTAFKTAGCFKIV